MIKIARIGRGRRYLKVGKYNLMFYPKFVWYDLWVGVYWDKDSKNLHLCLLPTLLLKVSIRYSLTDSELMEILLTSAAEADQIAELSNKELVKKVLETGVADNPLVMGLIDKVLPGWEDMVL